MVSTHSESDGNRTSLERGLRILGEFTIAKSLSVSELARRTGTSRSTVSRLAKALADQGYLERDPTTQAYQLGLRLWELGSLVTQRLDYFELARRALGFLSEKTGETIHFSTLDGRDVVYLDKIEGTQAIVAYTRMGGRAPAYAVASGRAMLSRLSPDDIIALYPPVLVGFTPHTITDRDKLIDTLKAERGLGYSVNRGEYRADVGGVAAAITSPTGPIAALGVTAPISRLTQIAIDEYSDLVQHAVRIASSAQSRS
jgi:IclR family KDG regulon transcriptional repressor